MSHGLFEDKVKLEPIDHTYVGKDGIDYISVTTLLKELSEKFESTYAYHNASEEKRAKWKAKGKSAADHGTRIHNALETYAKEGKVKDGELSQMVINIIEDYKSEYHKCFDEVCLYNNEFGIAGTADKICAISNRKDSAVDIADFKTNISKGIEFYSKYGKRLYAPFEHLQDCNYIKYSFQLSIYAYFFEELTGRKVRHLYIHYIPADDYMKHQKIPVIYLKNDVKLFLEKYRKIEKQIIEIEEEEF